MFQKQKITEAEEHLLNKSLNNTKTKNQIVEIIVHPAITYTNQYNQQQWLPGKVSCTPALSGIIEASSISVSAEFK